MADAGGRGVPAVREVWAQGPSLLTSLVRHWLIVLSAGLVVGAVAYIVSAAQEPVYEASGELVFEETRVAGLDPEDGRIEGERQLRNRENQILSAPVLEGAAQLLDNGATVSSLREATEVHAQPEAIDSMAIRARANDPGVAAAYVNAVGESYQQVVAERQRERARRAITELDEAIERLESRHAELGEPPESPTATEGPTAAQTQRWIALSQLVELAERRERLRVALEIPATGVASFQPALAPLWHVEPRPHVAGGLAGFLGLAVAGAYAYWREGNPVARKPADLRARFVAPVLADLPRTRDRRWAAPTAPRALLDRASGPYEFFSLALEGVLGGRDSAAVVVSAVDQGPGDAAVALNTALALCQDNRRVVLIDGNLRDRKLTRLWRQESSPGLADLGDPTVPFSALSTLVGVFGDSGVVSFLPSGSRQSDPLRWLRGTGIERLLETVEEQFDDGRSLRLVIHAPPVLEAADAGAMARATDGMVLVVRSGTRLAVVERAEETITSAGAALLGYAFVGRRRGAPVTFRTPDWQASGRSPKDRALR